MPHFTQQEKALLLSLAWILFIGSGLHFAFKKYPRLHDTVNLIDSELIYHKADINSASQEELVRIPYIGTYTAENIVAFRRKHGPFQTVDQLKKVKGIRDKNFERFRKYLKVSK